MRVKFKANVVKTTMKQKGVTEPTVLMRAGVDDPEKSKANAEKLAKKSANRRRKRVNKPADTSLHDTDNKEG